MSKYLEISDVKDNISTGQDLEPYLAEADEAIEDLAERLGAEIDDIKTTPLHYKVRRYGIAYALMRFSQDRISAAQIDQPPDGNKYMILYSMYKRELKDLDGNISVEMVTGDVDELRDRANHGTCVIFRG